MPGPILPPKSALQLFVEALIPDNILGEVSPADMREVLLHYENFINTHNSGLTPAQVNDFINQALMPLDDTMQQTLAVLSDLRNLVFDAGRGRADADFRALNVNSWVGNFPAFPEPRDIYPTFFPGTDSAGKAWWKVVVTTVSGNVQTTTTTYTDGPITQSNAPAGFILVAGGSGGVPAPPFDPGTGVLKVFLRGALQAGANGLMSTILYDGSSIGVTERMIPTLTGDAYTETVPVNRPDIVDRVTLFFYNEDAGKVGNLLLQRTAFLLKDGQVVNGDGVTNVPVPFPASGTGGAAQFRVRIKHRNHLSVTSNIINNVGLNKRLDYDFSATQEQSYQRAGAVMPTASFFYSGKGAALAGVFCAWLGDVDNNDQIGQADSDNLTAINATGTEDFGKYSQADLNLDGFVVNQDVTLLSVGRTATNSAGSNVAKAHNPYIAE